MKISFKDFSEAHSNYSSVRARKESSWAPVIEMLERRSWTPREYLDWIFREYRKPMVPKLLGSKSSEEGYHLFRTEAKSQDERRFKLLMEQVRMRLQDGKSLKELTLDGELSTNALLMYMVSTLSKDNEDMERFKEGALYECVTRPWLREIYSQVFDKRRLPC